MFYHQTQREGDYHPWEAEASPLIPGWGHEALGEGAKAQVLQPPSCSDIKWHDPHESRPRRWSTGLSVAVSGLYTNRRTYCGFGSGFGSPFSSQPPKVPATQYFLQSACPFLSSSRPFVLLVDTHLGMCLPFHLQQAIVTGD